MGHLHSKHVFAVCADQVFALQLALKVLPWVLSYRYASGAVVGLGGKAVCGPDDGDGFHRHPPALPVSFTMLSYVGKNAHPFFHLCATSVVSARRQIHSKVQHESFGTTRCVCRCYRTTFLQIKLRSLVSSFPCLWYLLITGAKRDSQYPRAHVHPLVGDVRCL